MWGSFNFEVELKDPQRELTPWILNCSLYVDCTIAQTLGSPLRSLFGSRHQLSFTAGSATGSVFTRRGDRYNAQSVRSVAAFNDVVASTWGRRAVDNLELNRVNWWRREFTQLDHDVVGAILAGRPTLPLYQTSARWADALTYLAILALLLSAHLASRVFVVTRRHRAACCTTCGYPNTEHNVCPECGKPTDRVASSSN